MNNAHYYVFFILDLYNSEIVGYSTSRKKSPEIVLEALSTLKINLMNVAIFHTDRGGEFKNKTMDRLLAHYDIERSLSKAGTPADNAVSESGFKIFKYAWNQHRKYKDALGDVEAYVNWYNNVRPHSRLGYQAPLEYLLPNLAV